MFGVRGPQHDTEDCGPTIGIDRPATVATGDIADLADKVKRFASAADRNTLRSVVVMARMAIGPQQFCKATRRERFQS